MALPTSITWDLADFSGLNLSTLLTLGPGDLTAVPAIAPYFSYNTDLTVLRARSSDGIAASLQFSTGLPSRFTLDVVLRLPALPHNLGDLEERSCGLTVADDSGRGFSLYFAKTGFAVARVDVLGAVSALPDTSDVTEAVTEQFHTVRIAVDGALGRAYVFVGLGATEQPALRWIVPIEETPPAVVDIFRLFVRGTVTEPVQMEIVSLRLASDLVIANYPPIADAGPDRVVPSGQAARLDGRASYDIEGAALSYLWRLIDAPFGSTFAAEISGFTTTDDGDADGSTPLLTTSPLLLPDWLAPGDVVRLLGMLYTISSIDSGLGEITVTQDAIPDNIGIPVPGRFIRQSILLNSRSETPTVVADIAGLYRFDLVVNDGENFSESAEVLLNATAARAPFGVEPDVSPLWKAIGDEWRLIENHGVFEEAWRGVAQILAGKLLEAWQHHYNSSIRDAQKIFQRKWVAYRTLEVETAPDAVALLARPGVKTAGFAFDLATPVVTGLTLRINYAEGSSVDALSDLTVVMAGGTLQEIVDSINGVIALSTFGGSATSTGLQQDSTITRFSALGTTTDNGDADGFTDLITTGIGTIPPWVAANDILVLQGLRFRVAASDNSTGEITVTAEEIPDALSAVPFRIYRACRLTLKAPQYFELGGTALSLLGFTAEPNYLKAAAGAKITDNVYFAGDGVDLIEQGVSRYDLLVLNNGESFRIDRVTGDELDPLPNQRILVFDTLPMDASAEWAIPSVVRGSAVDYEAAGIYPGDLTKIEIFDAETGETTFSSSEVIAQKGTQIAAELDASVSAALMNPARFDSRLLGVKRRKAIKLPEDVVGVPQLQDLIPVASNPTLYKENIHYILEPFYRDLGGAPIPMLQFVDAVFIDTDLEPPDILWAELTLFSNEKNVEDLFGRLVGFLRDDAATFGPDFNYVAGVAGLLYAQQRGPNLFAMQVGAQILLGQPFAEVAGYVEEIRADYSAVVGRILLRDDDGNVPTESEIVRTYYYKKDPLDLSVNSGLARNIETGDFWIPGDRIPQFSPLGAGIDIFDLYNNPTWWIPFVRSGVMSEVEKFQRFLVQFNTDLVTVANIQLLFSLITKIKPTYTAMVLGGLRAADDDLDLDDMVEAALTINPIDSPGPNYQAFIFDDYRGDGTTASSFDDGFTRFDGIVDNPTDLISLELTFDWGGGMITEDLPYGDAIDVTGDETGTPGSTFTMTLNMDLEPGTYMIIVPAKDAGVVYP